MDRDLIQKLPKFGFLKDKTPCKKFGCPVEILGILDARTTANSLTTGILVKPQIILVGWNWTSCYLYNSKLLTKIEIENPF